MASIARLAVSLTANTRGLNRGLKRGRKQVSRFASAIKGMGLSTAAAFAAAGLGLRRVLTITERFNQAMRSSLAIMGNVTEQLSEQMERAAFKIGATTRFSATEATKAYFFLASAGFDAEKSLASLTTVAKFAQAGNFDLALATDILTDAQSALGITVKDTTQNLQNMTRVADVLVKANTLANATVQQFSEALVTKAGAALRLVGKEIEEGAAILAVFADQGLKGAQAGTALQIIMRDLQTKALRNKAAFAAMNIRVFDAAEEMRNMADIVEDLERELGDMSDAGKKSALLMLGFTDRSISFTQALIGTSGKLREMEAALKSAGGTMAEVAEKQMGALEKSWKRILGLLAKLKPLADDALSGITVLLNGIAEQVETIGTGLAALVGGITQTQADRMQASFGPNAQLVSAKRIRAQEIADAKAAIAAKALAGEQLELAFIMRGVNAAQEIAVRIQDRLTAAKERALQVGQRVLQAIRTEQQRIGALNREKERLEEMAQGPAERLRRRLAEIQEMKRLGLSDRAATEAAERAFKLSQEQAKQLSRQRMGEPQAQSVGGLAQVNLARQAVFGIQQARNKPQAVKDPQLVTTNQLLGGILDRFETPSLGPAVTAP